MADRGRFSPGCSCPALDAFGGGYSSDLARRCLGDAVTFALPELPSSGR
jgi:hypothetical protein